MQGSNTYPAGMRTRHLANRLPLLALSALLAACQAPKANSTAWGQTDAANAITTTFPAAEQTPAAGDRAQPDAIQQPASAATAVHELVDEDGNPYRPDDSYNRANLRAQYKNCADASGGVTPAIQACIDEEFRWQQERMRAVLRTIGAGPDGEFKDKLADEQDAYMRDTDRYCRFDPATQGQGHMLDAQSCRINRYANRADVLEALVTN